jgi:hypothetical protein
MHHQNIIPSVLLLCRVLAAALALTLLQCLLAKAASLGEVTSDKTVRFRNSKGSSRRLFQFLRLGRFLVACHQLHGLPGALLPKSAGLWLIRMPYLFVIHDVPTILQEHLGSVQMPRLSRSQKQQQEPANSTGSLWLSQL